MRPLLKLNRLSLKPKKALSDAKADEANGLVAAKKALDNAKKALVAKAPPLKATKGSNWKVV